MSSRSELRSSPAAPTAVSPAAAPRSLAPDVARGLMLLLIALAHTPAFANRPGSGDAASDFIRVLVADNQARWMFILLFGYAIGQLISRQAARGTDVAESINLLRRRGLVLLVVGLLHAVLLVPVDILAAYGTALLILAGVARATDRRLLIGAAATFPLSVGFIGWQTQRALSAQVSGERQSMVTAMTDTYLAHVLTELPTWLPETLLAAIIVTPGMLLGIWASRRRLLDEPEHHLPTLRTVAIAGLTIAVAGRLPAALLAAGTWTTDAAGMFWLVGVLHTTTGYAGGIGLAAMVALITTTARSGTMITALAALGQRSLTFYLGQSAVLLVMFYPFTLGLYDNVTLAGSCLIAVGMWCASVIIADIMRRAGTRGPLEDLVRRLIYRTTRPEVKIAAKANDDQH